ncbi:MAG: MMPL family transporter [Actinomycetes bacterium]
MGPVSRWAVRRPWQAIIAWLVMLVVIFGAVATHGGKPDDSFVLKGTDSSKAAELLEASFGSATNNASVQIVYSLDGWFITDPALVARISETTKRIESLGSVASVSSPYTAASPLEALASGLVNITGTVGKINIAFKVPDTEVPKGDGQAILADVQGLTNVTGLIVGASGTVIANSGPAEPPISEAVGILVALLVMFVMFGSAVAAGLPLMTALIGLVAGLSLLTIAESFTSMASFAPNLAVMIGLGVGFDYSLFMLNRYREAILAGSEPTDAALIAVGTAGRAIVFAALTVVIALCGLFALGMSFLNGLAIGAGITVVAVMVTAVTLLPAIVSLLGPRTFAWKAPWARKPPSPGRGRRFRAYASLVERWRWVFAICALVLMVGLAIPVASLREGFPDAGGNPGGDPQRIAFDLTAAGFGPGANGPFIVVAQLPNAQSLPQAQELSKAIGATPGVALASPVLAGSPAVSADGKTVLITVIPKSNPQSDATTELLDVLRGTTIPKATAGTGITAYVGGATAVAEDFSSTLRQKLPLFLLVVVGLGFLVLMVLFRSLLIPLTAALTALLSYGAALGVSIFIFQQGHFNSLFGVHEAAPILPFLPVMLFAILFGLSMDYQVFLVSRMQEEWGVDKDNRKVVRVGLGGSGLVVVAAATIMFFVFMSFVFQSNATIKLFGFSLAVAIALDAFVIRLVFVPALMTILGRANWYLPRVLNKILPKVSVEGSSTASADAGTAPEETHVPVG